LKGFAAYQLHTALNLHFSEKTDYDYFKYNGKTSVTEQSFNRSPLKWQYVGIENAAPSHAELMRFFFSAYRNNNYNWIPGKVLARRIKTISPLDCSRYLRIQFASDLMTLASSHRENPTSIFDVGAVYPLLYEEVIQENIQLESYLLIDAFINSTLNSNDQKQFGPKWPDIVTKLMRVRPFIAMLFDRDEVVSVFTRSYLDQVSF